MEAPTLVFLPGLGADERLFVLQRPAFPSLIVPRWLDPLHDESLRDYAARMAAHISSLLSPSENLILGGVSMGGMVAQEIAHILKPRGLILIATCLHPREIAGWIRTVVAVERFTPSFLGDHMRRFADMGMPAMGVYEDAHKAIILEIAQDVSFPFARWAAGAILSWPGAHPPQCPTLRIHGRRDRMIRAPRPTSDLGTSTVIIAGGGHVLNLTHAEQVNRAITSWLETLRAT